MLILFYSDPAPVPDVDLYV